MSIKSDLLRGNTDAIILSVLSNEDCYGYKINQIISSKTDGKFELKEATLYSAFKRLEKAKFIVPYWGKESTNARRRYYEITQTGINKLAELKADWHETKKYIDILTEEDTDE